MPSTMATIAPQRLFYGFSTLETNSKQQTFADIPLIKRDLYNHFNTLPGERVMMPRYGCGIWNLLFEPFEESVVQRIVAEATRIVETDSRVQLQSIIVTPFNNGVIVQMQLFYLPYGVADVFNVTFDQNAVSLDTVN
jgi:phage baseplate assembly protein W